MLEVFKKDKATWTEEEQKQVDETVETFKKEIQEVCTRHCMAYKAVLVSDKDGIRPTLDIVVIDPRKEEKA